MAESKSSPAVLASAPQDQCVIPTEGVQAHHSLQSFVELNTPAPHKLRLPVIGFGVYQSAPGPETEKAVLAALKIGYRHIDTAQIYGNEQSVGAAIRKSGLPREEIFVTTKLWNTNHGYEKAIKAVEKSLKTMELDYLDLVLIHWPVEKLRLDSWRALEHLQAQGKIKSIGVSNYMVRHLQELLAVCKVRPCVNQIEVSPYGQRKEVVDFCKKEGIVVEAYSPLTQGVMFDDPALRKMAAKYGVSPAKILLRWGLQHGLVILPKSVHEDRIKANTEVFGFHLAEQDMKEMEKWEQGFCSGWDPTDAP